MRRWLLIDYGGVISTPLPQAIIDQLAAHAGLEPRELERRYCVERPSYNLGESDLDYWARAFEAYPSQHW